MFIIHSSSALSVVSILYFASIDRVGHTGIKTRAYVDIKPATGSYVIAPVTYLVPAQVGSQQNIRVAYTASNVTSIYRIHGCESLCGAGAGSSMRHSSLPHQRSDTFS